MSESKETSIQFNMRIKVGVEIRFDPLVGSQTRINPARASRPMSSAPSDTLSQLIAEFKDKDPFAPYEKLVAMVPSVDEAVLKQVDPATGIHTTDKLLQLGEGILFPNKFPFGENHGVVVSTKAHYVAMPDFTHKQINDTLSLCREYIRVTTATTGAGDGTDAWPIVVWNYMPPSAGSIIHPHFQVFNEDMGSPLLRQNIDAAVAWKAKHGGNFFETLIREEEATDKRFIGRNEHVVALAPFAPRGANETILYVPGVASIGQLTNEQASSVSDAIIRIVKAYEDIGVGSFNLASFSAPVNAVKEQAEAFTLMFKFWSRPYPSGLYTNDSGPTERMYDVNVVNTVPESYAQWLKKCWNGGSNKAK